MASARAMAPGATRWLQAGACAGLSGVGAFLASQGSPIGAAVASVACAVVVLRPWKLRGDANKTPEFAGRVGGPALMAREIVPVWRRHLTASRDEADRGVNGLLQHFSSLSDGLNEAIAAADGGQGVRITAGTADDLVEQHPEVLRSLIEPLERLRAERRSMLAMLCEVEEQQKALHRVASELSRHARHVGLVAMNAAIEATRAGQYQGGFAAVANEVRSLSEATQSCGRELDTIVSGTSERLVRLRREAELSETNDETLEAETRVRSRELIGLIVNDLGNALEQSRRLRESSRQLRDSLDGVFIGFQFQDRLNQMLGSLHDDLDRFEQWLRNPETAATATALDAAQWLKQLEATYTMQEQLASHHGTAEIRKTAAVEFF